MPYSFIYIGFSKITSLVYTDLTSARGSGCRAVISEKHTSVKQAVVNCLCKFRGDFKVQDL